MNASDIVGWAYNGSTYCLNHKPEGTEDEVTPIFADSEWDSFPFCDICFFEMNDVNLTEDGVNTYKSVIQDNIKKLRIVLNDFFDTIDVVTTIEDYLPLAAQDYANKIKLGMEMIWGNLNGLNNSLNE